jgi:hypothetical protein
MRPLAAFLSDFVAPLVAGGEVHIGPAVDLATAQRWMQEIGAGVDTDGVDEPRRALAAGFLVSPPKLALEADELAMAVALYNVLALAHPAMEGLTTRSGARPRVLAVSLGLASRPPAANRRELVGRHTLLSRLFELWRQDVRVRWWTGSAEFRGQKPSSRLQLWPRLRNVRVTGEDVRYGELFAFDEAQKIIAALLDASPLTDHAFPERGMPAFAWSRCRGILTDAELARYLCTVWTEPGRARTALPAAAAAWERLLGRSDEVADVRAVTAFLVHTGVIAALDDPGGEAEGGLTRDAALFWALPELAARVAPELAAPPGLGDEPGLKKRWDALRQRATTALPMVEADRLAGRLAAALGR